MAVDLRATLGGAAGFPTVGGHLEIDGFLARRGGLPIGVTLRSRGVRNWRMDLPGIGPLPTSAATTGISVDYHCSLAPGGGIVFVAGDVLVYAIRLDDGAIAGSAGLRFTYKDSLDHFACVTEPVTGGTVFVAPRSIAVFDVAGRVVRQAEVPGLATGAAVAGPGIIRVEYVPTGEQWEVRCTVEVGM